MRRRNPQYLLPPMTARHEHNTRLVDLKTSHAGQWTHTCTEAADVRACTCTASALRQQTCASMRGTGLKAASVGPSGRPDRSAVRAPEPGDRFPVPPPRPAARSGRGLTFCRFGTLHVQRRPTGAREERTTVLCVSASVSERDKPRIKKNGKAQRHQGRIWYSEGPCQTGI